MIGRVYQCEGRGRVQSCIYFVTVAEYTEIVERGDGFGGIPRHDDTM